MTAPTLSTPRSLLGVDDLSADEFAALLDLAATMKRHPLAWRGALDGRAVACVFKQPSTRSRVSLEVAVHRLGALPVVLEPSGSIPETARALSSYCDAIAVRTTRHRDVLDLAAYSTVPVINALTDREHPCRALADCLALRERFGELAGMQVAYIGGRDAAMHSLIEAAMLTGMTVRIAAPEPLLPDPSLLARAGQTVRLFETAREAVSGAVGVYEAAARRELPDAYTVTPALMAFAAPGAIVVDPMPDLLPVEQAVLRAFVTGDWET